MDQHTGSPLEVRARSGRRHLSWFRGASSPTRTCSISSTRRSSSAAGSIAAMTANCRSPDRFSPAPSPAAISSSIATRQGKVNAFYNLCTHRGGRVCREKSGKATSSSASITAGCSAPTASLRGIPQEGAYPEGYKNGSRGLVHVPRLEQYRGFWFICLDANAMSLSDYLAGAKEYIDNIADQSETDDDRSCPAARISRSMPTGSSGTRTAWTRSMSIACIRPISSMPPMPPRSALSARTRKAYRPRNSTPRPAPRS